MLINHRWMPELQRENQIMGILVENSNLRLSFKIWYPVYKNFWNKEMMHAMWVKTGTSRWFCLQWLIVKGKIWLRNSVSIKTNWDGWGNSPVAIFFASTRLHLTLEIFKKNAKHGKHMLISLAIGEAGAGSLELPGQHWTSRVIYFVYYHSVRYLVSRDWKCQDCPFVTHLCVAPPHTHAYTLMKAYINNYIIKSLTVCWFKLIFKILRQLEMRIVAW